MKSEKLEDMKAVEEKYLDDDGSLADHVDIKNRNRNTDKGRQDQGQD